MARFRLVIVLFAGILCVSFSFPALAKQCFTPTAMNLTIEKYKINCVERVTKLTTMLRSQKTPAKGTEKTADIAFKELLNCAFETNPILKTLKQDSAVYTDADKYIEKFGLRQTILEIAFTQFNARTIYRIDELEERASSKIGLSEQEVKTLAGFAKVNAKYDALLAVLHSCEN